MSAAPQHLALALTSALALSCHAGTHAPPAQPLRPETILPDGVTAWSGPDPALPSDDLAPLWKLVGTARVIGIGESVHTSGGYYATKERLIRVLIEERGVRFVAMEAPRAWVEGLDAYVTRGPCTTEPRVYLMKTIPPVFSDDHTAALFRWLCEWNQKKPSDPVHVFGFDMQEPAQALAILDDFVTRYAGRDAKALEDGLAGCSQDFGDPIENYEECLAGIARLSDYLDQNRTTLTAAAGEATARKARTALGSFRAWQEVIQHKWSDVLRSYEARDREMAAIFEEQLAYDVPPEAGVIVWAHNDHLAAAHSRVAGQVPSFTSFGEHLRQHLGERYAPIALVAYYADTNWPMRDIGPIQAPPGSVEARLHALGRPFLLLDPNSSWLPADSTQVLGNQTMVVREQFTAVLYLDESPAMKAVFGRSREPRSVSPHD